MLNRRVLFGVLAAGFVGAATTIAGPAAQAVAAERMPFETEAFQTALAEGGPVLIDIAATWCPTCHQQERIVDALMEERPEMRAIRIFVVDYDTRKDVMRDFGATSRATLIAFKGGAEVGRVVFETRPEAIEALLASAL